MPGTTQGVHIAVRPEDFFRVITAYEQYPEFLDDMKQATVLSHTDNTAEVQFTVHLIKRLTYTLLLTESAPHSLRWHLKEGPFKVSNGSWTLEELDDGSTQAQYEVEVKVAAFVPKSVSTRIVGKTVPALLAAFKSRAEALYTL